MLVDEQVDGGKIEKCIMYSDALLTSVVEEVPRRLEGIRYSGVAIAQVSLYCTPS